MPEFLRTLLDRISAAGRSARANMSTPEGMAALRQSAPWIVAVLVFILVIYYPLGMLIYSGFDADVDIKPAPEYAVEGGSAAVAIAATVAAREANDWIANKPFFHPSALLDN